jgi:uncharacterized protein
MARSLLVDTGFLVALLNRTDSNHHWAAAESARWPPPWGTCEAVLSETFHLLGSPGNQSLIALVRRGAVSCVFRFGEDIDAVLRLSEKYAGVPMSFADACLVRMTETHNDPMLLTTDSDFRIYRRHGRQAIPCVLPR